MYYLFKINSHLAPEIIQLELEKKGLQDPFILEDGEIFIGGHSIVEIESKEAILVEKKENLVNWEEQWAEFAEDFYDGRAHVKIGRKTLELLPGAGFGDLSHPTTNLMLQMMEAQVLDEHVLDIGSGSGILTLASLLLGAKSAHGIDIDEAAIQHAKKNANLNQLKASFSRELPEISKSIFLMNMILPEQRIFAPQRLNFKAKFWIVSGIMTSQQEEYLHQAKKWGWDLLRMFEKSDWLGFIFRPARRIEI